jgi:lysozyme
VNAAQALTITAAAALLVVTAYQAQRMADEAAPDDADQAPSWADELDATMTAARNLIDPVPAAELLPSYSLREQLKRRERLQLTRYRLGDGGWTIGYGRYYPDGGELPPESIDEATANAWFDDDIEARGARWVRTYVTVPLTQYQFDALVSMAFNLRPSSFRKIAEAVNAGEDPEATALQFVRAGTNLEAGLRARRADEIALYREGLYA